MKIFHSHTLNPMVFNEHQSSQFHIFQTQLFSLQDSWLLKWNGGGAFSCQSPPFKEAGLNMRPLSTAQVVLTAPPLAPPISSCRCGGVHSQYLHPVLEPGGRGTALQSGWRPSWDNSSSREITATKRAELWGHMDNETAYVCVV